MLTLHGYWRSSAAYRVRIALNLKGLDYAQATHDLRQHAHQDDSYRAINPQKLVPALDIGSGILTQSPAILEWLEEMHPEPALLPASPDARAAVRAMCALIACDIHPLNNLRVLRELKQDFGADQARLDMWASGWIAEGFTALEVLVEQHGKGFCFGDTPSLADCFLIPQVFSAQRFGVDLRAYPALRAVNQRCDEHPAFVRAHPNRQPDAPDADGI